MSGFERADPRQVDEIAAFLEGHAETSMFPLSNLRTNGMQGGHVYAVTVWCRRNAQGAITDVVARTTGGYLNPQCPDAPWQAVARALTGQTVLGAVGPAGQVRPMLEALGLAGAPVQADRDEPFMRLSLADLVVPEGPGRVVPIAEAPRARVLRWIADYSVEALGARPETAVASAAAILDRYIERDSHVVLIDGDEPLAMTGFNARTQRVVQIGGVFAPTDRRGRGHARRALGLHLRQAQRGGAERAVLSAAGDAAARTYTSLGFRETDRWAICLFDGPQMPCPR